MDGQTVCRIRVSIIPVVCPLLISVVLTGWHGGQSCSSRMAGGQSCSSSVLVLSCKEFLFLSLFRQVVEGWEVLERLEGVETYNERPKELCQVSNSGRVTPLD